jgi:hypothetical protein
MDFAIRRQSFCKVAPPLAVVLAASTLTALGSGRPKSGRPYFQTASGQPLPPEPMAPGDRAPSRQLALLANRYADFCSCAIRGGGSLTIPFFGHPFFFAGATLESRFLVTRFFFLQERLWNSWCAFTAVTIFSFISSAQSAKLPLCRCTQLSLFFFFRRQN